MVVIDSDADVWILFYRVVRPVVISHTYIFSAPTGIRIPSIQPESEANSETESAFSK